MKDSLGAFTPCCLSQATDSSGSPENRRSQAVASTNRLGLHLRAAQQFACVATSFKSKVRVSCEGREVDGKSLLELASLAAACGSHLEITTCGADAEPALRELVDLVGSGFHEEDV